MAAHPLGWARFRPRLPSGSRRGRLLSATLVGAVAVVATLGLRSSLALFTDTEGALATSESQSIFSGERRTTAFDVVDRSSGTVVNRSSALAFGSDSLTTTTSPWSSSFAAGRYVEFDLNDPLPATLALSSVSFTFRFASGAADATACYYFEVRRASTGSVLDTHGSSGTPVACVTGTSPSASTTAIPSVTSTDISNDLRIRVYGNDSGATG
jgi:hypothetical protein